MDKTYDPHKIESRWYDTWENNAYFAPQGGESAYCIMIPPPNVTGTLHMGHAFQNTLIDTLIRYHRMKGHDTLWQPGTDHAGIATQMVVERQLDAQGKTRHDLGREAFIERVWEWKAESGGTITRQLRRLGASADWSRERFTMDEGLSDAVQAVFIKLYDEGLIYRGNRLVNWDPVLHTALSDLEVLNEEEDGHLWHLRYPLKDGSGHLTVATTRPETMLGDTAVAVHPTDERYRHLIGQTLVLPLVGREIPIVGDEYVDPEFGSGCVKITPAHDFNDYEVGKRHDLPMINLFTRDAAMNDNAPEKYRGMDRYDARKAVVADLEALGLLDRIEKHRLKVPRGDRSNSVVEPYLTDQWYVDLTRDTLADGRPGGKQQITDPAINVVRDGSIRFVPSNWDRTYYQWLENIQDWCISRQLWWGHRIPAWYDQNDNIYVAASEAAVREKYKLGAEIILRQDEDVLDTWFSSALWPFSTLGWPQQTAELEKFYPTSVLVTGFDIIFFWVARMIMFGNRFMQDVPFREVYIHGLVRDSNGQKMSKSKGNVLDPLDIIDGITLEDLLQKRTGNMMQPHLAEKIAKQTRDEFPDGIASFGTDALRFTFASLASTGRDVRFDLKRVEGYRNFCNKIWNASRFVLMNVEEHKQSLPGGFSGKPGVADRWITSSVNDLASQVSHYIEQYRFDLAAQAVYEFTWNEYCDWYLELCKPALHAEGNDDLKNGVRHTLVSVLEKLLRIMHPLMPYITEELWQTFAPMVGAKGKTIMLEAYPEYDAACSDPDSRDEIDWIKQFVMGVRKIRSEMDIPPGKRLPVLLEQASQSDIRRVAEHETLLLSLARIEQITLLDKNSTAPEAATALVGDLKLLIPLAGLVDKTAELERLDKELAKLDKEIKRIGGKLANDNFVSRAPVVVVEKERQKLAEVEQAHQQFQAQYKKIQAL